MGDMAAIAVETLNYRNVAHPEYDRNKAFQEDIKGSALPSLKILAYGTGLVIAAGIAHHFVPEVPLLGNVYDFSHNWAVNLIPGISHSADAAYQGISSFATTINLPQAGDLIDKNFILGEELTLGAAAFNIPRRLAGRSVQRRASEKFVGAIKQYTEPIDHLVGAADKHLASRVVEGTAVHPDLQKAHRAYAIGMAVAGMLGAGTAETVMGGPTDVSPIGLNDALPLIELAFGVSAGDPTRKMRWYERGLVYPICIAAPVVPADVAYGAYSIARRLLTKESSGSIIKDIQHLQKLYPSNAPQIA